jgi:hypothetical protein
MILMRVDGRVFSAVPGPRGGALKGPTLPGTKLRAEVRGKGTSGNTLVEGEEDASYPLWTVHS